MEGALLPPGSSIPIERPVSPPSAARPRQKQSIGSSSAAVAWDEPPPRQLLSLSPAKIGPREGFAANSPVFAAAAARTLSTSADGREFLAQTQTLKAQEKVPPVSDADKKRSTMLDIERAATSALLNPPKAVEAATEPAVEEAEEMAPAVDDTPLGQRIVRLLVEHPPGSRGAVVMEQLRRFVGSLPYFEVPARRACLDAFCQLADCRVAPAGERLARQGEVDDSLCLLLRGRCSVCTSEGIRPGWRVERRWSSH